MEPSKEFMKKLKSLDNRLDLVWRGQLERWVIVYKIPYKRTVNLMLLQEEDGSYRPPNDNDLAILHNSDMSREMNKNKFRDVAEYMLSEREKDEKKAKSNIRDWTKDNKIQLVNAFAKVYGMSKSNSAFRRISLNARGKVY